MYFDWSISLPWLGPIWGLWHKLHAKFSIQERVDQFTEARKKDFGFFLKLNPLPGLCVHPLQCQGLFPSNGKWNSPNRKENLSVQDHRCLAPNDIANLWKTVNRIRIIMGEFGCTQTWTSTSLLAVEWKKYLFNILRGSQYFAHRLNRPYDKIVTKKCWPIFGPPRVRFWPNFGVIWGS